MQPLALTHYTLISAIGSGLAATREALQAGRSGLRPCDFEDADLDTYIGRVPGVENAALAAPLAAYDCRNNRLAQLALRQDAFEAAVAQARARYGAARIAVVVGTSTSGILATEMAYRRRDAAGALPADFRYRETHNVFSAADFVRRYLRLQGPALSVSTACSSGAKVFASAARLIEAGVCDAAVVGGVDSLCFTTLYGFASLELTSRQPCRPADAGRDGITIGEGAGFALLERGAEGVCLLGYGESSDAYHMSSPHPEGDGAALAMRAALERAGLESAAIDYINLHGTASKANDSAEDLAVTAIFGTDTPCSSTKGWTGHTLGAAGIIEAIISALCIRDGFMPRSLNTALLDPALQARILLENRQQEVRRVLSNSIGFGGNNCSLILGEVGA